jgi:cyclin-dependent kinase-like
MDPSERPSSSQLLKHDFFRKDNFAERFAQELRAKITKETADNPLLKFLSGTKHDEAEEKARRKDKKMKKVCNNYKRS